jgi:hypothetical protein
MPRTKISEFSVTPGDNTDIDGINIAEGCAPSGINDAIRELMAQLKDFQSGAAGDNITVVGTLAAKGTSSSGADLKLYEDTDNGTNYVGFMAPASIASNVQWTLPSADGSSGQALQTNGSGTLSFATLGISAGGTGQTTANAAFNALAPSQTSNAGRYLKTDGTNTSWDLLDISTADITGTLPVANGGTGITSFGTGVATALGINVGSSGAFVTNGGALGTPSSGTVTNLTGTASININGTVGATTPNTGSFTTVTNSGGVRFTDGSVERARLQLSGTSLQLMAGSASVAGISIDSSNIATFTNNPILSAGTANGVAYLNGSKVLTTGSALTFNGTRFSTYVTSDTNTNIARFGVVNSAVTDDAVLDISADAANNLITLNSTGNNAGSFAFQTGNTEQMRLTSTGLGIGTSSFNSKLALAGFSSANQTPDIQITRSSSGTAIQTGPNITFSDGTTNNTTTLQVTQGRFGVWNYGSGVWNERFSIDAAGNAGLGVTPSAWSSLTGLQFAAGGLAGFAGASTNNQFHFLNNAFHAVGGWTYVRSDTAQRFTTANGQFQWWNAPSGTAGNAISFTQALTLDANRNLLLNGTTAGASSVGTLTIFNGTAPTGSVTDGVILFAADVSSSSELRVRDEAGNVTTLSPHNFELIPEGPSEDMAWAYYSEKNGKKINVDMLKLARMVEKLTGEKLVYES